jgi:hypothetical protein
VEALLSTFQQFEPIRKNANAFRKLGNEDVQANVSFDSVGLIASVEKKK